jgi:hypothetical protein
VRGRAAILESTEVQERVFEVDLTPTKVDQFGRARGRAADQAMKGNRWGHRDAEQRDCLLLRLHHKKSRGPTEFNLQQSRAGRRGHVKRPV